MEDNGQLVWYGVNDFSFETTELWSQGLRALFADAGSRKRMGLAGRQTVGRQYCIQVTGSRLAELLKDAAKAAKGRK